MSANTSANFLGLLLAACLASGVSALEVGQTPAPAGDTPSFGLPAFLDGARLPDLQEAWRAHFGSAQATPTAPAVAEPTSTPAPAPTPETVSHEEPAASPDPAADAAIESARAALTRAERATDKAASVRARAEDLSRRFGAGDAAAAPPAAEPTSAGDDITTGATAAPGADTETAAQGASAETAAPSDGAEAAAPAEVPADQPATAVETTATAAAPAPADVASDDKSKASSLMRAGLAPASVGPSAVAARKPATPTRSAGTAPPAEAKSASGTDLMPTEIRAFGWNSQP